MNYKFPVIEHIDQIREAIKGREEFIEADRGDYIVFNYLVAYTDSFDCELRRECRGLIFNPQGKVLSRRFHKFFNMGEREETLNPDLTKEHIILEKLDGSMITPLMLPSGLRWATKMGVTDIGLMCENYVNNSKIDYKSFVIDLIKNDMTPIFEFMSPQTRIVIDHKEENLVLLAVRQNRTGIYYRYENMLEVANYHNIPVISPITEYHINEIKDLTETEGIVVRFKDGHMLKVKTDWYCSIHKMKENLLFEKNVIKLILEDKIDDILPALPEVDKVKLNEYKNELLRSIDFSDFYISGKIRYYNKTLTKKDYALTIAPNEPALDRSITFSCWDRPDKNIREEVIKYILKHTGSQKEVDSIRYLLPEKWCS